MDSLAHDIWDWAIQKNNWLSATHIPGTLNEEADKESRKAEIRTEWMLDRDTFRFATSQLGFTPEIDLFATRINHQVSQYVSYRPDPGCMAVNAFTLDWSGLKFYAFPPFICLPRVIQKICNDGAVGMIIVPNWPNQPWFSQFLEIVLTKIYLPPRQNLLQLPQRPMSHPLNKTLGLYAAIVSGKHYQP